jgi:hypothetical protein
MGLTSQRQIWARIIMKKPLSRVMGRPTLACACVKSRMVI